MSNLNLKTRTKYGLHWPREIDDIFIDLILAKQWKFKPFCHGDLLEPGEHLLRAIRALFTREQWTISPWTEQHAHAWAAEDFIVILGGASCSKSSDIGGFCVLDWITDPRETYIALASTSVPMLKLRSFESVVRYFRILKSHPTFTIPGKESMSQTAIINDNDADDSTTTAAATAKASIRGVALSDGDEAKAVARLAGAHLPWVTIVLDEGSALPEAAAKARFNAAAGSKRFRFVTLANPVSIFDEATKFAEPLGGWGSVDETTEFWRSRFGLVLHHNGFQSPAIVEENGAEKYPYLINGEQIDRMLSEVGGNEDDPMVWRMAKGFPAPQGLESTVLTSVDLVTFHAFEQPVWREDTVFQEVAGLDPAFTSDGDGCILQRARIGMTREGLLTICFHEPDILTISASSGRPAAYQVSDQTRALAAQYNLPIDNIDVDDSGTQSVADIIEVESGKRPMRRNFGAKPTDAPTKPGDPRCRYANLVTEIWHRVAGLVRENQVRGFPKKAASQFCSRRYRKDRIPLALESKAEYKKRWSGQRSPDEGDALALCVMAAVRVAGLAPWKLGPPPTMRSWMSRAVGGVRKLTAGYADDDGRRFKNYAGV
jgi:hypothetical protein